jgi:hypothetical protein
LRWTGLKDSADCPGAYAVQHTKDDGWAGTRNNACSHGPDPAPAGVDAAEKPSLAALQQSADGTAAETGSVPCYGDGTSGRRIQAIYAVASDRVNRYASVLPLIRGYAANADDVFNQSAARGGQVRHLRWVTNADCQLDVLQVVLTPSGDDSIGNTRSELQSLGIKRTDRKYIVWADASVYCGISYTAGDARPDDSNPANNGPTYSRVDSGCWGLSSPVEAHEITHGLGGVQLAAPHSNGAWHCTDEYDRLCYNDGSGATMNYVCGASMEAQLDCNGDDYFNVAPVPGTWLASHWNIANSLFLEDSEPSGGSSPSPSPTTASPTPTATATTAPSPTATAKPLPTVTPTSSPTVTPTATATPTSTPTASPSPTETTVTSVFSSSLSKKSPTKSFSVSSGAGKVTSSISFSRAKSLTLTVATSTGSVLAKGSGPSVLKVLAAAPSKATYTLTVSGADNASFTLTVTRP